MPAVRVRNLVTLLAVVLIAIILNIGYVIQYVRGNDTLESVILFCSILNFIVVLDIILYAILKDSIAVYGYCVLISCSIVYLIEQCTTDEIITFCYIIPIQFAISAYNNRIMQLISSMIQIITVSTVWLYKLSHGCSDVSITEVEIAILSSIVMGITAQIAQLQDIKDLRKKEELEKDILKDTLTKCYNRKYIDALEVQNYFKDKNVSIILGDINDFKSINDTLGHTIGDVVLIRVGKCLIDLCDKYEHTEVVRIGGDEFIIVTTNPNPDVIAKEAYEYVNTDSVLKSFDLDIDIAFGYSRNISGKKMFNQLYEEADKNMYGRKDAMKNKDGE